MRLVLFVLNMLFWAGYLSLLIGMPGSVPWPFAILGGLVLTILLVVNFWAWHANPAPMPFAPSPFADRGHNVYRVANDDVRKALAPFLKKAGFTRQGTFRAGPTDQELWGNDLVLMVAPDQLEPKCARALVVRDPIRTAERLKYALERAGFSAEVTRPLPGHQDKFAMVTSSAFVGGYGVAFRVWGPKMGKPEKWIK